MSVNTPPEPNVATFNNLYWITDEAGLTVAEANKKYLKFPVAQGTENLQAINVNGTATFNSDINCRNELFLQDNTDPAKNTFLRQFNNDLTVNTIALGFNPTVYHSINSDPFITVTSAGGVLNNTVLYGKTMSFISTSTPTLTATPPLVTDDSTKIATTAWVQDAIDAKIPPSLLTSNNTWTGTNLFNNDLNVKNEVNIQDNINPTTSYTSITTSSNGFTVNTFGFNPVVFMKINGVNYLDYDNIGLLKLTAPSLTFSSTNPPISLAIQPDASNNSNKMPTTAWVQTAIDAKISTSLLTSNNTWSGTNLFNNNTTFGSSSNIIQTASSKILQQPATTGYTNPTTNVFNPTDIRTSIGASSLGSFQIIESVGAHIIEFNANATDNAYDPIVNLGDSVISTINAGNLVLTNSTGTATNGIRLDSDKLQLGFGGAVATPTNNITFNTANGVTVNGLTTFNSNATITSSIGASPNNISLTIKDTVSNHTLLVLPDTTENVLNYIVNLNDFAIGIGNAPLVITHTQSVNTNGIRFESSKLLLGFGGVANIPTNNITFDASGILLTSPLPPTSSAVQPNASNSSTNMPTTAWVQTAITAATPKIPIANNDATNTNYFPVFTTGVGDKTGLLIDSDEGTGTNGPFKYNPITGNLIFGRALKVDIGAGLGFCRIGIGLNSQVVGTGNGTVAVGQGAGNTNQGINATAISINAGAQNQGANCIAIGPNAGQTSQGSNSICIGINAGAASAAASSICLNADASSNALNPTTAGLFINPVRNITTKLNQVQYDSSLKEVSYVAQVVSPVTTSGLELTGAAALLSETSGSTSGQHLVVVVNGVTYKIELKNV
jgi:hypothetical protein